MCTGLPDRTVPDARAEPPDLPTDPPWPAGTSPLETAIFPGAQLCSHPPPPNNACVRCLQAEEKQTQHEWHTQLPLQARHRTCQDKRSVRSPQTSRDMSAGTQGVPRSKTTMEEQSARGKREPADGETHVMKPAIQSVGSPSRILSPRLTDTCGVNSRWYHLRYLTR